ncbi:acyl-CoA dehydrogenase family protein, partial [Amycolatopsis sp. NPDC003861]
MAEPHTEAAALATGLAADAAAGWDLAGELPRPVLRELGVKGVLCAQVAPDHGGLGLSSVDNGELTAHVGTLCGSLRSVLTSQGMAAWAVQRLGTARQRAAHLTALTGGALAGVAFSEPGAGSDLAAMETTLTIEGDEVVVDGAKVWVTVGAYADLLVVIGKLNGQAGCVVVPADAPGVRVTRVPDPLGCRAAGHADVRFDRVRLPADALLGGTALPLGMLVTTVLTYGRISVAWGCAGMLRTCLAEAARHVSARRQGGVALSEHQLVRRHLAGLYVAERSATLACARASRCWDEGDPDLGGAAVLAKHVAATGAAAGAAT